MRRPCDRRRVRARAGRWRGGDRSGIVLVWFALLAVLLLGMVGLVIDGGLLMARYRQAQNAADAAALAAAHDLMYGVGGASGATTTANTYVTTHNGLSDATVQVSIPPATGAYQGEAGYVEVVVEAPLGTYFIHLLGVARDQTVRARAVAGSQAVTAGEGVCVLNPLVTGLTVGGTATLQVKGLVVVNSEGKGVDADGNPVGTGENYYAARAANNAPAYGRKFHVVGGVDWPQNFRNIDPNDPSNVLFCGQLPVPDPLLNLPVPTTALGVDPTERGSPVATNTNLMLNDPSGVNYLDTDPETGEPRMVLHPGVYTSIEVTGGNVWMKPGIYVLKPAPNNQTALKITGGNIQAKGIMFYNTGHNFDPETGYPDNNDHNYKPPPPDGAEFGAITMNAGMQFGPIDLDDPDLIYGDYLGGDQYVPDATFDGMLFFQRRRNTAGLDIQGDLTEGSFQGTLYAKWAHVKIAGSGIYDAQFVVGSMEVTGSGVVTIDYAGTHLGKAPQIFLVE